MEILHCGALERHGIPPGAKQEFQVEVALLLVLGIYYIKTLK